MQVLVPLSTTQKGAKLMNKDTKAKYTKLSQYRKPPSMSKAKIAELNRRMAEEKDPEKKDEIRLENPRAVYRMYDEHGKLYFEYDPVKGTDIYPMVKDGNPTIPPDQVEEFLRKMYSVDEQTVRKNDKELKLNNFERVLAEERRKQFIEEYVEENGVMPNKSIIPKAQRVTVSIYDRVYLDMASKQVYNDDTSVSLEEFMFEIVEEKCTEAEKQVYLLCIRDGLTQREAAKIMHVSKARISQHRARIIDKLREKEDSLKKYFRPM